jgi:MoaA/NifB/PqqE/SkfB family radical SAM enzyme
MDTRELKDVILSLRKAGVAIIYFVGGDVFLRDDIFELIQFAGDLGLRTHLTINAYTVTEDIARALAASKVASLHLSLDTLTDDFDDIRGVKDARGKVLTALRLLVNRASSQVQLGIATTTLPLFSTSSTSLITSSPPISHGRSMSLIPKIEKPWRP